MKPLRRILVLLMIILGSFILLAIVLTICPLVWIFKGITLDESLDYALTTFVDIIDKISPDNE